MDRKFSKPYKKHTWLHRSNLFNHLLRKRLTKLGAVGITKTLFTSPVLDQGNLDRCTAFCMCALRAAVTGKTYSTDQYWADEMSYENDEQGVDAQTAASVAVNPGWMTIDQIRENADAIIWIYPNNGQDMKDSMNSDIVQFQSPCAVGFIWYSDWENTTNGVVPTTKPVTPLGGHLTMFGGDNPDFAPDTEDNQGSWGTDAPGSKQGHYGFPRSVINGYVEGYPCFIPFNSTDPIVKILGAMSSTLVRIADLLN